MLARLLAVSLFMLAFAGASTADTRAKDRVALVFGMANYQNITALRNTINDAGALAKTLEEIGFSVDVQMDATRDEALAALDTFAFKAETADIALIYYAGHGVSVQGTTFLIPVDAKVRQAQGHRLGLCHHGTDACCRGWGAEDVDPDPGQLPRQPVPRCHRPARPRGRQGPDDRQGRACRPSPERGTLVAYAARNGEVAMDGDGANSPFNIALRDNIVKPNLEISLLFRQVRDEVLAATATGQEPRPMGRCRASRST